tara:strand:- start:2567 stop:3184 length:618 start_codon:yes stop_codon:yes gene_type:complete
MNEIKKRAQKSNTIVDFSEKYFLRLSEIFSSIDKKKLLILEKQFLKSRKLNKNIFIFGNGGSAANASTMANDLGFDILKKTKIKKIFKITCLNDNSAVMTAISNDTNFQSVFLNQLKVHFRKGDMAIILSASGNSKNLINAAKWIIKNKGYVFAITGFDGGLLKKNSNDYIHVKSNKGEYGPVEDIQLIINHILAHWFQVKLINK